MPREGLTPINLQTSDPEHVSNIHCALGAFQSRGVSLGEIKGHTLISDTARYEVLWEAVRQIKERLSLVEGIEYMSEKRVEGIRRSVAGEVSNQILTNLQNGTFY